MVVLPGMTSTMRTLTVDSDRARVLGEIGHATHLQPGRRLKLVAGNHGAGMHRDHLGLDAENPASLSSTWRENRLEGLVRKPASLFFFGSSSRASGGSVPGPGEGSNRGTWRSRSTRLLVWIFAITGSMRGGLRRDLRLRSTSTFAPRSRFTRPASQRLAGPRATPVEVLPGRDRVAAGHVHHVQPRQSR